MKINLLVCLHLYYLDQAKSFVNYLRNLNKDKNINWTLVITSPHDLTEYKKRFQEINNKLVIYTVPNLGYDIYPFMYAMRNIDYKKYDWVLKLHTKTSKKRIWRSLLIEPLIGSANQIKTISKFLLDPNCGMIASEKCTYNYLPDIKPKFDDELRKLRNRLNITIKTNELVGGTMFYVRPACLKTLIESSISEKDFLDHPYNGINNSYAHYVECVFLPLVLNCNYKVAFVDKPFSIIEKLNNIRDFFILNYENINENLKILFSKSGANKVSLDLQHCDVYIFGNGKTIQNFNREKGKSDFYIGTNRSFLIPSLSLDLLFVSNMNGLRDYVEDFKKYSKAKKIVGRDFSNKENLNLPNDSCFYFDSKLKTFHKNLTKYPFFGKGSDVVFHALQFAILNGARKIHIVGCDCTLFDALTFENIKINGYKVSISEINKWVSFKNFVRKYFSDLEIFLVNPITLKGFFKDEFTSDFLNDNQNGRS